MQTEQLPHAQAVAVRCADIIAQNMHQAIEQRGQFTIAFSGGSTPHTLFQKLAEISLPWHMTKIFQVDERLAPDGDKNRNFTHLKELLLDHIAIPASHIHPMPVTRLPETAMAMEYEKLLISHSGAPPRFDLVHLGIGQDGHTASLVPHDPILNITGTYVAMTGDYKGFKRLSLTYSAINDARCILWQITGKSKLPVLDQLISGDTSIPAGQIARNQAIIVTDCKVET
jgi:6-phosphogluconolactonase